MIPNPLIQKAKNFAYSQIEKYGTPTLFHLELSNEKGQFLAETLKADKTVILLGTLLIDCMVGQALKERQLPKHIEMSARKTAELLSGFPELTEPEEENIIMCVKQHHGVDTFYSLEAEICCNADCYRFASVRGVIAGLTNPLDFSLDELVNLYSQKADEKWNALTLDICRKELEPQYKIIKTFLNAYK